MCMLLLGRGNVPEQEATSNGDSRFLLKDGMSSTQSGFAYARLGIVPT